MDHLQPRHHLPLIFSFKCFNIKAPLLHCPVMQKEVDEILAKDTIESSTGFIDFYSNLLVRARHTDDLHPIQIVSNSVVSCPHLPFKVLTIKKVHQCIQQCA